MNIITINQLVSWFQSFQERHFFLKDFGFGEPYDIGVSRQMNFPYMWINLNDDSVIPVASNNKTAIPEISFTVLFMDKINDQDNYLDTNGFPSDNSQEILSDCLQYLQDLITEVQSHWQPYGVLFSQDISFFPVIDDTTDKSTGINARVVLRLKQVNCIIPVSPIPPTPTPTPTPLPCYNSFTITNSTLPNTLPNGIYEELNTYTGGTFTSGYFDLSLPSAKFIPGIAPDGKEYKVFGYYSGTRYITYLWNISQGRWRSMATTGNYYTLNGTFAGSTGNVQASGSTIYNGYEYPEEKAYTAFPVFTITYPLVCPTPTPTQTSSATPTPTPTLT